MKFIRHTRPALVCVLLVGMLGAPAALGLTTFAPFSPAHPPVAGAIVQAQPVSQRLQDYIVYIVQRGDTLYSIAGRFDTTVAAIMDANGLVDPHFIWVGQRLIVPSECELIHVVQRGETMYSIAKRYGTTVADILVASGLSNPDLIWVGQQLIIPVCATPTPTTVPTASTPSPTPTSTASSPAPEPTPTQSPQTPTPTFTPTPTASTPTPMPTSTPSSLTLTPGPTSTPSSLTPTATPTPTPTPSPTWSCEVTHVVQRGETVSSIARYYGTTVSVIVAANGLVDPDFVWVGQRLVIPLCDTPVPTASPTGYAPTPTRTPTRSPTSFCSVTYVVQSGDSLSGIAWRYSTTVAAIMEVNGLTDPDFIWVGQRLIIPSCAAPKPAPTPAPAGPKWIDVNLSTQTLIAYQGSTPVLQTLVSTGTSQYPSPVGTFYVYLKLVSQDMSGPGYYLPDVPYVMYFYSGYAIHGTYWHSNFGQRMSHGCINLPIPEAGWLYDWAPMSTQVTLHY